MGGHLFYKSIYPSHSNTVLLSSLTKRKGALVLVAWCFITRKICALFNFLEIQLAFMPSPFIRSSKNYLWRGNQSRRWCEWKLNFYIIFCYRIPTYTVYGIKLASKIEERNNSMYQSPHQTLLKQQANKKFAENRKFREWGSCSICSKFREWGSCSICSQS